MSTPSTTRAGSPDASAVCRATTPSGRTRLGPDAPIRRTTPPAPRHRKCLSDRDDLPLTGAPSNSRQAHSAAATDK
ncbi:hypothetical protein [Streptomyces sp. NPDC050485]|uniref:hypothetical protein n=1 Tax=Streptomyces sp. NPDC050485 TaxID=3365617 RepID=UPI0037B5B019